MTREQELAELAEKLLMTCWVTETDGKFGVAMDREMRDDVITKHLAKYPGRPGLGREAVREALREAYTVGRADGTDACNGVGPSEPTSTVIARILSTIPDHPGPDVRGMLVEAAREAWAQAAVLAGPAASLYCQHDNAFQRGDRPVRCPQHKCDVCDARRIIARANSAEAHSEAASRILGSSKGPSLPVLPSCADCQHGAHYFCHHPDAPTAGEMRVPTLRVETPPPERCPLRPENRR